MKLIKRTTLHFQEGTSDKIYEVDLCQIDAGRYVVNFRYGRRGSNLKEGTKTTQAVPLETAQREFNKLVKEKAKKGYREVSVNPSSATPVETTPLPSNDAKKQIILNHLTNNQPSKWKLERVIWRAGELKISEAVPLLLKLIGTGAPMRDYCIAWALGYCGDQNAIPVLIKLYQSASSPEFVSRIAFEALLKLADPQTKVALQAQMIDFLPLELQNLAQAGSAEAFTTELRAYLQHSDYKGFAVLDRIYQIDNQYVRPALIEILRNAPFKPNYFQRLRHIFKMAEYRHDSEVFGIFAYRLEKERHMFRRQWWQMYKWDSTTKSYVKRQDYLNSPDSNRAYSDKTREYLRRRVWRTLKQLGEEGDSKYVNMAVDILLQYSDQDAQRVWQSASHRWEYLNASWTKIEYNHKWWDAYAGYSTFNHILYENSPRYELKPNSKAWRCRENYKPGDAEPTTREEAFPQLWEQHPQALLQLLLQSKCRPVHHFAVKALRVCDRFVSSINIDTIIGLVNKPYEVTAQFGFELAHLNYNPASPNKELILALVNCLSGQARTQAYQWIEQQREFFLEDSNLMTALVVSQQSDTRAFARRLLASSILSDRTSKTIIGCIIAELLALTPESATELVKDICETLLLCFAPQLRNLGLNVINDLLAHPILEIQELAARILLNHEIRVENLPPEIIESLVASPYESLRVIGIRLFGQLPDEKLIGEERTLIVAMAVNANAEIRNAIQPIIRRLSAAYPAFAMQIAADFIGILLIPEQHEGVHSYLVRLLREDLQGWMSNTSKDTTLKLIQTQSSAVQELGGFVLAANYQNWLAEFSTSEIVKLADHEILSVREAAQQMFLQILDQLRADSQEMLAAVRILEAKWQDSRDFAFKIFTTEFSSNEFTPQVLVSICDSVREEARSLGRDLLTRNFQTENGEEYLLKFSEHPSADMQLFATNYLEKYAVNNPERLQELMPFFISVLCRVNRGSVAKKRIFTFLEAEAQKSEAAAKIVAEIMIRQSATMAIGDKAAAMQIMLKIHKIYPKIPLPIQVKPVAEVRS